MYFTRVIQGNPETRWSVSNYVSKKSALACLLDSGWDVSLAL